MNDERCKDGHAVNSRARDGLSDDHDRVVCVYGKSFIVREARPSGCRDVLPPNLFALSL